eukprot:gene29926-37347_t
MPEAESLALQGMFLGAEVFFDLHNTTPRHPVGFSQQKGRKPQKQKKRATFAAAAQTTLQSEKASQLVKRVAGLEAQADLHKAYTSQFGLRLRTRGLAVGASASSMMAVLGRGGCSELQLARILMEFQEINESFRGFSAKECGVLAARMAMVEIPAGDFVQMEGDPCTCVLLVVQGALHTHHGKGGVKTHVTPCGAIHGAAGLFKPGTRTTDVYSSPDKGVTVLVLFFDQIAVLERSHPATCVKLHRAIGRSALHDLRLHLPVVAVQGDSVPAGHCEEGMLNNWQMTKFSWMEKQEMVTPVHRAARDAGMPGLGELDATDLGVRQHSIIAGSDGTSVACLEHAALEAMNMELPALARKLMGIFARIAMHRADSISRGMTDEEWLQPVTGTSVQQNATQRLLVDHACGFSDKEIMAVNACLKFVEVKAEEEVIGHGTTCQCLCMVVAGKLAKYADGKQSACLGHYEPGDIFGEHAVIAQPWHPLPLSGHTVTATSMTPCA